MLKQKGLTQHLFRPGRGLGRGGGERKGSDRPVQFWPGRGGTGSILLVLCGLILFLPATSGCGGATAQCPTPTTELDRLRDLAERLDSDLERGAAEERTLRVQREDAGRRIEAANALLDSLAGGPAR